MINSETKSVIKKFVPKSMLRTAGCQIANGKGRIALNTIKAQETLTDQLYFDIATDKEGLFSLIHILEINELSPLQGVVNGEWVEPIIPYSPITILGNMSLSMVVEESYYPIHGKFHVFEGDLFATDSKRMAYSMGYFGTAVTLSWRALGIEDKVREISVGGNCTYYKGKGWEASIERQDYCGPMNWKRVLPKYEDIDTYTLPSMKEVIVVEKKHKLEGLSGKPTMILTGIQGTKVKLATCYLKDLIKQEFLKLTGSKGNTNNALTANNGEYIVVQMPITMAQEVDE